MSHVAAVSWAATQAPETTLGNHSPTKPGLPSANQMEVFCFRSLACTTIKMTPIQRVSTSWKQKPQLWIVTEVTISVKS